jgi:predicted nucleotidyltransferase
MIAVAENEMKIIIQILQKYITDGEVRAFGSRYKHTAKPYSDLDIAIIKHNQKEMTIAELAQIKEAFEESILPYRVDVLDYWGIHDEFRAIIDSGYEVLHSEG